jgi:Rrf2 family protein
MQLNRSTDYAIQMLVYLAKNGQTLSSTKLAASLGISHRYLLQISSKLRAAGFILAVHGPSGGLKIFKNPDEISLYDVILSMEGVVQTGKICGLPSDELEQEMVTLEMAYQRLNILLERELKKIMLSDII